MTLRKLRQQDPGLRIVYKELPILGADSLLAARAALAARAQGKYLELHEAMLASSEPMTGPAILEIARGVGLDADRLEADMGSSEITAAIERNRALARALNLGGTPAFVIGAEIIPGAVSLEALQEVIARTRGR